MTTTHEQFAVEHGLSMHAARTYENPNMDDDKWHAYHWRCTLRKGRRRMVVYFSMGSAHQGREPALADVLNALALDSSGYENSGGDFEQWCDEYGYDTDSRRAERTFKAVEKQAQRLQSLLGSDAYEQLLWRTEEEQ